MNRSLDQTPTLRWPLDVQYLEVQGRKFVTLRDDQGVATEPLVLPIELLAIVSRLDGENSLRSILIEGEPYGLTEEMLFEIVSDLDELRYLDTPEVKLRWEKLKQEYADNENREAAHAGRVYPEDPAALKSALEDYLREAKAKAPDKKRFSRLSAIISPHIDYQRGWQAYAAAHAALESAEVPDIIFLVGTSHQASEGMFHLTRKNFVSPLGMLENAQAVVEDIGARYGPARAFGEEILHRTEHSLELQLPFLQHCYRGKRLPKIVPILVGSFYHYFFENRTPIEDPRVSDFVDAVAESVRSLESSGLNVLFYGGVDLAHIGTHFGDKEPTSDARLKEVELRDRQLLDCVLSADEEALFAHMSEDNDERRICGYPSMYMMFSAMRRAAWRIKGECLEYRQAADPQSDCIVSFASAVWGPV